LSSQNSVNPANIPIFHITHIDNLSRVIKTGGLWCDAERLRQGFTSVGIAHDDLKRRRARKGVKNRNGQDIAAGGVLSHYVPFYLANRSPMLYSIHCHKVAGYAGSQEDVIYLVSSIGQAEAGNRPWFFTDGHAVEAMTEFFADTHHLDKIDWGVIRSRYWFNMEDDLDRRRRKQAEFLIWKSVPWDWFCRIGVIDCQRAERVKEIISASDHQPEVTVERSWYYD
jgi:hypothetical protein